MKRKTKSHGRRLNRSLGIQTLENRQVMAASMGWDGPGQGSAELSYHISGSAGGLTQEQTKAAIEKALSVWSSVADIKFTPTTQSGQRNSLDISFSNIDGVGGTLAQAYFPKDVNPEPLAGNIQFDASENWEIGNAQGSRAMDLVYVAVHEIAHALGLDHSSSASSVLNASVSPTQSFTALSNSDIAEIRKLYRAADSSNDGNTDTTDDNSTTDPLVDSGNTDTTDTDDTTGDQEQPDSTPFPTSRWHRHGNWRRWGDRVDNSNPDHNYASPTDVNQDSVISPLDALLIINQISRNAANTGETSETPLRCDTSGDGTISPLDALRVINALSQFRVGTTAVVQPINTPVTDTDDNTSTDDNTTGTDDDSTSTDDDTTGTDDNTTGTDDNTTDTDDNTTDTDDNTTDTDDNTTDTDDNTTDTDDDTDDEGDESDHPHCDSGADRGPHRHETGSGKGGHRGIGLLGVSAEDFVAHFDSSEDNSLTADELPAGLWDKLIALDADTDASESLSVAEVDALISSMLKARYDKLDTNSDSQLTADEVGDRIWASLGEADSDTDDSVSFDEFKTWLQSNSNEQPTQTRESRHGGLVAAQARPPRR